MKNRGRPKGGNAANQIDMIGKVFGNLTVISYVGSKNKRAIWLCKCDCGTRVEKIGKSLRNGSTKLSCGCVRKKSHRWTGHEDISGTYWMTLVNGAKFRGIEFKINIRYIWRIFLSQNKKCALTGEPISLVPDYSKQKKVLQTASLDRIDPHKGYVKGNVQWVHKKINRMKWKYSQDEFLQLCSKVVAYQNKG